MGNPNIDLIYNALASAETGGEKNKYIRTKISPPGGSSAFGPVQITNTLAEDYTRRGLTTPESKKFYEDVLRPLYEKFLYHGNMKGKIPDYNPIFDYGQPGDFDVEKYGKQYESFAKDLISRKMKESGGDMDKFIQSWRGKKRKADPAYWDRFNQAIAEQELANEMVRQLER